MSDRLRVSPPEYETGFWGGAAEFVGGSKIRFENSSIARLLHRWGWRDLKERGWDGFTRKKEELKEGLGSYEGLYDFDVAIPVKESKDVSKATELFVGSFLNKMLGEKTNNEKQLCLDMEKQVDEEDKLVGVDKEIGERDFPYVVRVLRPGSDEEPSSFVDVVISEEVKGQFNAVSWNRVIDGEEIDEIEGVIVGEERFLSDWMREESSDNALGDFYRPDVLIGRDVGDFKVKEMSMDGRPMLSIGLETVNGRLGLVNVATLTHVPFTGSPMLEAIEDSWIEVSENEKTRDLVNFEGDEELASKSLDRRREVQAVPFKSWLGKRFKFLGLDTEVSEMEEFLEVDYYQHQSMLELAKFTGVRRGLGGGVIDESLLKLLLEVKKDYQKEKKKSGIKSKLRVVMLVSLAMADRYPGFMAVPNKEEWKLITSTLGLETMEEVFRVKKLVGEKSIQVDNYLRNRLSLEKLREEIEGADNINKAIEILESKEKGENWIEEEEEEMTKELLGILRADLKVFDQVSEAGISVKEGTKSELLKTVLRVNVVFASIKAAQSSDGGGVKVDWRDSVKDLFNLDDFKENFPLTEDMIGVSVEEVEAILGKDDVWSDAGAGVYLREKILEKIAESYYKNGAGYVAQKLSDEYKRKDEASVKEAVGQLSKTLETAGVVLDKAMDDPEGSPSSRSAKLGELETWFKEFPLTRFMSKSVFAVNQPENNISALITRKKEAKDLKLLFRTAFSRNVKDNLSMINNEFAVKMSMDNSVTVLETMLPYLRHNKNLSREFLAYCVKSGEFKNKDIKLMDEMLFGERYAGMMDRGVGSGKRKGGYRKKRQEATMDEYKRRKLIDASNLLIGAFVEFGERVKAGEVKVSNRALESVSRVANGGFGELLKAYLRHRVASFPDGLAELVYIMRIGLDKAEDTLGIRTARAEAMWIKEEAMGDWIKLIERDLKEGKND